MLYFTPGYAQNSDEVVRELHKVKVKEMSQTKSYTYMLVAENGKEWWVAAPKMNPVIGATYYYLGEMQMKDFYSKELDRTFDSLSFVEGLLFEEIFKEGKYPVSGGTTIANMYMEKDKLDGQIVTVRGKVTKFNEDIMDKNWIHLDDGTNILGNRDFVATSKTAVKVGDVVTLSGKIAKNVDLGHGYTFEVLMQEARVVK